LECGVANLLDRVQSIICREKAQKARRFASPEAAFRWLKLPGMELREEDSKPKPIVNRCWCGKPISNGRNCCNDCRVGELKQVAGCIRTSEALEMFLQSFGAPERATLLADLQPYLSITEFVEEVCWRCDCGESGIIHVRQESQPDNAVIGMALEFHHNSSQDCPIVGLESKGCSASVGRSGSARTVIVARLAAEPQPEVPEQVESAIDPEWVMDTE
jgi:hypothetical protein